jgi:hypothetical protein
MKNGKMFSNKGHFKKLNIYIGVHLYKGTFLNQLHIHGFYNLF